MLTAPFTKIGLGKWIVPAWVADNNGQDSSGPVDMRNSAEAGCLSRPAIIAEPVEFNPERSLGVNQLLPYLHLNFTPQYTPTTKYLCALYALATSFKAVHSLNCPEDNQHYTA
jgi:hypothetical protein